MRVLCDSAQLRIDALHGKAHHVEVAAAKPRHANVAYPFLYTIGASLVKRTVFFNVVVNLLIS